MFTMQTTTFEFVPREEVPAFVARLQEDAHTLVQPVVPPTLPPVLSSDEIISLSLVGDDPDEQQPEPPRPTGQTRLYLKTTNVQRRILMRSTRRTVSQSLCLITSRKTVFRSLL